MRVSVAVITILLAGTGLAEGQGTGATSFQSGGSGGSGGSASGTSGVVGTESDSGDGDRSAVRFETPTGTGAETGLIGESERGAAAVEGPITGTTELSPDLDVLTGEGRATDGTDLGRVIEGALDGGAAGLGDDLDTLVPGLGTTVVDEDDSGVVTMNPDPSNGQPVVVETDRPVIVVPGETEGIEGGRDTGSDLGEAVGGDVEPKFVRPDN